MVWVVEEMGELTVEEGGLLTVEEELQRNELEWECEV